MENAEGELNSLPYEGQQLELLGDNILPVTIHSKHKGKKKKERRKVSSFGKGPIQPKGKEIPLYELPQVPLKTFESFAEGPNNEMALQVAKKICEDGGPEFPFVYFVGGPGLGKTHLLNALAYDLTIKRKKFPLILISGKELALYYLEAYKNQDLCQFFYDLTLKIDCLIIDEIEELLVYEEFQQDFCIILDQFFQRGKQLVVAGTKNPQDLTFKYDKLTKKLSAGLIAEINETPFQTAKSIVDLISEKEGLQLQEDTKSFLANQYFHNIYFLESILSQIKFTQKVKKESMGLSRIQGMVGNFSSKKGVFFPPLAIKVANFYHLDHKEIFCKSRKKEYSFPRHLAMYLLQKNEGWGIARIAKIFGRDHSSVIYAISKVENLMAKDEGLKETTEKILNSSY